MGDDEALQPLERIGLPGMIERQYLRGRGFRRRVGEILAVGKDALKLNVRVKVAKQKLRRSRPLERKRRLDEQKNRRDKRHADVFLHAAPQMRGLDWTAPAVHAVGGSVEPGPSERCIMIESVQRPNLYPTAGR